MIPRQVLHLFLALLPLVAAAQEPPLKAALREELWISVGARGRAPQFLKEALGDHYKRIRLSAEGGYRSADNFFAGRQLYLDLGGRYKVTDLLGLGVEYRYANRGEQQPDRQRIGLQAFLEHALDRWDIDYRFTWQREFREEGLTRTQLRNRVGVGYNFPKWKLDPEFSVEFFTGTDTRYGWDHIGTRYKLGTNWSPWKGHTMGPAVLFDRDANVAWPTDRIIWSFDYSFDLRRL